MKTQIIVILSALVLALSGYMLYDSLNNEMSQAEIQTQMNDLKSDYEFIQKDLEVAINDANFSNKEVLTQKNRIEKLLKKNNITQDELQEAKKLMRDISRNFLDNYKQKVNTLEKEKEQLLAEKTKTTEQVTTLKDQVTNLDTKVTKEKQISEKKDELLSYASKLSLSNFLLRSFKVRNNGKEIETDKASKIDRIKLSFDVNQNLIANSGDKLIYMSIKKPTGETVTFSNKTSGFITYKNRKIPYSDKLNFKYDKDKDQKLEFVWDNEDFSRGDYIMEVYEQNNNSIVMIGKVTKTLE